MSPYEKEVLRTEIELILSQYGLVEFTFTKSEHRFGAWVMKNGKPSLFKEGLNRGQADALVRRLQSGAIAHLLEKRAAETALAAETPE